MKEATANASAAPRIEGGERSPLRRFAPAVLIVSAIAVGYATGWHSHLSLAAMTESRDALRAVVDQHYLLSLMAFVLLYIVVTAVSLPVASLLTILSGYLFGWLVGGLAAVLGATIGATLLFLAARSACGSALRDRVAGFADRLACGFENNAFGYLLVLRLAPFIPFCVVNVAPALFKVPPRTFVAATAVGMLPGAFAYASLGYGVDSVVDAAADAGRDVVLSDLVTPQIAVALVGLALVALVALVVRMSLARRVA